MAKKPVKRGRVERYYAVMSPRSTKVHRLPKQRYKPVEGDRTACGRQVRPGWSWHLGAPKRAARPHKCTQCFGGK